MANKINKRRYNEIVKESHDQVKSDYPEADDNVWSDFAQMVADSEPGLREFIKKKTGCEDPVAYLADDISGPSYMH